jgi:simple sugar transport system substrate-binding protein
MGNHRHHRPRHHLVDKVRNARLPRALVAVTIATLTVGFIAACGSSTSSSGTTPSSRSSLAGTKKGAVTIGFVVKLANPYFVAMTDAVKQWAAQHNVHLLVGGGSNPTDVEGQITAIQTMISEGAKAFVVSPQGPQLTPALQRAVSQHIPVVLVNEPLPHWSGQTSYVGTDNYKGAVLAGKYIRAHLKSGDKIAIEAGIPGVTALDQRVQGVLDALKGSGISVVANLPTQCLETPGVSVTNDILAAHPDIQGIYFACSPPVFGGLQALSQRNLSGKLLTVGFDGDPQEYKDIRAGQETATVAQFPRKMGVKALQLALKALAGHKVPKNVDSGQEIVSKTNASQFHAWR